MDVAAVEAHELRGAKRPQHGIIKCRRFADIGDRQGQVIDHKQFLDFALIFVRRIKILACTAGLLTIF
jgi:hypothetical protein